MNESLPPPADLRTAGWGQELLWLADYQRDHSSSVGSQAVLQRPRLGLSFLPVSHSSGCLDVNFTALSRPPDSGQALTIASCYGKTASQLKGTLPMPVLE